MSSLCLSLREIRMVLERLVQAAGVPDGLLPSVRDAAVYAAILPVSGFDGIERQIAHLKASVPHPLVLDDQGTLPVIDGSGQHAWLVADAVLDVAIAQFRLTGQGEVKVTGVAQSAELRAIQGQAERHALAASVEFEGAGARVRIAPRPAATPTRLDHVRRNGFVVAAATWWPLYHASHAALAPDSFESRRHAGTVRVEADGRIVGRNDEDETDLAMLAADPARLRADPVSSTS
ncbi:hypothetical protein [Reyranella sp. CPCC 100927]|uniref:hypothetical protein n=1 Tax=Reyranella sp. CPCC 100927 TaxID=2599616 RepID=UPI0011B53701|nr:hypothetical protein [Reyranella sp. CPCC 100927]TWT15741.1 hypothetical protein FQU96_05200 [Reyranella sp. CPCC 100927]